MLYTTDFKAHKSLKRKIHNYLPSLTEATNSCSVQAHYNSKETVEIPLCFTAITEQHNRQFGHFLGH